MKALYKTDSKRNYQMIEERITKMKHYSMTKVQHNKKIAYGIFDFVDITTMPNGTRIAEIHVNEVIYRDYIQRQTVRIYKNKVEKIKFRRRLSFAIRYAKKSVSFAMKQKSSYNVTRDYLYFSTKSPLSKKTKKKKTLSKLKQP